MNWHPLRFVPIYKERVWGGRQFADRFGRALPSPGVFGESWEVCDRPDDVSRVDGGPLAGRSLAELLAADPHGLLGEASARQGRFPLLVKILDAHDVLSLQVHPPSERAGALGGESKTEMWYFVDANPGAAIYAGLRQGVTKADFEGRLAEGTVDACFHKLTVRPGDAMFLPSGRPHALGAGLLLFEIQENSDTTYRVFDWNRRGLDGRPRALHVAESLASIDFGDFEPALLSGGWETDGGTEVRRLVDDPLFDVEVRRTSGSTVWNVDLPRCAVLGVVRGRCEIATAPLHTRMGPGDFVLLPAALRRASLRTEGAAEWLVAWPGSSGSSPS